MRRIRSHHRRKQAENENNDPVPDSERVEQDAPNSRDVERAPDEFVGVPGRAGHLLGRADVPDDAVVEKHALGDGVGSVEATDADGDDGVEGGCGADVDEADDTGDEGHDEDCVHWDGGFGLDLWIVISVINWGAVVAFGYTVAIVRQKGSPRSRPKAHTIRDEVARKAIAAQISMMMMMQIMVEAPESEPVAS